ncbi:MAG: ABC transporter permease [Rhodobacteraceae bacterium]|nr:ABC transporter permease [Paracoccaceae bacterium]
MSRLVSVLVILFLFAPLIATTLISFNATPTFGFPSQGLSLRWYANVFARPEFWVGFRHSLLLATLGTLAAIVISTLTAVAVVRFRFPGRSLMNALVMSPIVIPEVVLGLAILVWIYAVLDMPGAWALYLLHTILVIPYIVRMIIAGLQGYDINLEHAAMLLGASPFRAFLLITLPSLKDHIMAGAIVAFIVSLHNFTATMFLVLNRPTLPTAVYQYIRTETDPTVAALSTLLLLIPLSVVAVGRRWLGLDRMVGR